MTTKHAIEHARRRTAMVPVATMEEIPVPGNDDRAEMLALPARAATDADAGKPRQVHEIALR